MSWVITGTQKTDPDALAYLAEVERADGQALESGVRDAVIAFVVGCKTDGIWSAIKASCILAGARTLAGALVPLVGTAPTNVNFVSGDYERKTGLLGNGSNKYLNSNRVNNSDPQDNNHNSIYASVAGNSSARIISSGANESGTNSIITASQPVARSRAANSNNHTLTSATNAGLMATSRSSASSFVFRVDSTNASLTRTSQVPSSTSILIFQGGGSNYSSARIAFYSIGESLDLALLDHRVTALINAFAAAIP
jgi:hypothetical protein